MSLKRHHKQILRLFMGFSLFVLIGGCSFLRGPSAPELHTISMSRAFDQYQIIGEGTDFLTLKCDVSEWHHPPHQLYALVLDDQGYPLRKVSGYTHDPQLKGRNHLWFHFFLYAPKKMGPFPQESHFVKFVVAQKEKAEMVHVVKLRKTWGSARGARVFDLPSPQEEIPGYLILKDYTFFAKGDFRKPEGYFVEGKIFGAGGHWYRFSPLSEIQGEAESSGDHALCVDQGWLELETGNTHSMKEAVAPMAPYIEGWWDGKGYFHPRPIRIHGFDQAREP